MGKIIRKWINYEKTLKVLLSDGQDCLQIRYEIDYLTWEVGKSGYYIMGKWLKNG